jgi:hypothetical protein
MSRFLRLDVRNFRKMRWSFLLAAAGALWTTLFLFGVVRFFSPPALGITSTISVVGLVYPKEARLDWQFTSGLILAVITLVLSVDVMLSLFILYPR